MAIDLNTVLTRDAVLKGIARFDAEYREKPELPGFDGSKKHRWFIEHEGRQYPVKATVALGLGVERNAFRRAPAILRLEEIGFPVVYRDYAGATPARAWLFQANPKQYDLQGALNELPEITWQLLKQKTYNVMHDGDTAFFWVSGAKGGLVATGTIVGEPSDQIEEDRAEAKFQMPGSLDEGSGAKLGIRVRIDDVLDEPIQRTIARAYPEIRRHYLFTMPQFRCELVPDEMAARLRSIIALGRPPHVVKIQPGENARFWEDCKRDAAIYLGFDEYGNLGDLSTFASKDALSTALAGTLVNGTSPSKDKVREDTRDLWLFRELRNGDVVVAGGGTSSVLGVGIVTPDAYRWDGTRPEYRHRLAVDWEVFEPAVTLPANAAWQRPVRELEPAVLKDIFDALPKVPKEKPKEKPKPYEPPSFGQIRAAVRASGLYYSDEVLSTYLLSLQTRRFVILTGISGTGKTRLAKAVADAFRRPGAAPVTSTASSAVRLVQVMPYMRKFARLVLPSDLAADFMARTEVEPDAKRTFETDITYPGGTTKLLAWVDANRTLVQVLFRGEFRKWFLANCDEGQPLSLELRDAPGMPALLSIQIPEAAERPQAAENCTVIAVKPDWTDHRGLIGFFNPISGKYEATSLIRLLLAARNEEQSAQQEQRDAQPFFVILDEMNLARVEHYFAEFLSCLESDEPLDLHHHEATEEGETDPLAIPRRLDIPRNVYFTGTVNVDETTYMFSPKVLDRAFNIELNEVDLHELDQLAEGLPAFAPDQGFRLADFRGLPARFTRPQPDEWIGMVQATAAEGREFLVRLNDLLAKHQRHFGYRVATEISRFVLKAFEQAGGSAAVWPALDLAVRMKVLPKLHGTQQELEGVLGDLFAFAVEGQPVAERDPNRHAPSGWKLEGGHLSATDAAPPRLPRTAAKLWRMQQRLEAQGFASFIE